MREQFGQVEEVERPAQEGDFVSVDITPEVDGQPLEEGSAKELPVSHRHRGLIEGADEVLEGATAGQELTIDAPLPEASVSEPVSRPPSASPSTGETTRPPRSDRRVGRREHRVLDRRGAAVVAAERMAEVKRAGIARRFADRALETLVEQVELDLPEAVVRAEMDEILHRFVHRLEDQQLTLGDYFQVTGISQEQFLADLQAQADRSLRTRILLDAIIADAGLEVGDDELEAVLDRVARQTDDPEGFLRSIRGTPQELAVRADILRDKALKLIIDNATPVDPDGNVDLDLDDEVEAATEGEVVAGDVVEGGVVVADVVEGEIVEGEVIEHPAPEVSDEETIPDQEISGETNQEKE